MTVSDMLKNGCIEQDYTLNGYFVRVYPIFQIDKVKFSFVKKNTSGKDAFDIYVDTWIFQNLCDDILSGAFLRKLVHDTGDYPTAFQYTTGENASRHLSIGAGKAGIVISGRVTGEKPQNAMVKVVAPAIPSGGKGDSAQIAYEKNLMNGYSKLRCMARLYNLLSGNIPLIGYNRVLYTLFWNGEAERRKHFRVSKEELEEPAMPADPETPKQQDTMETMQKPQEQVQETQPVQEVTAKQVLRGRFRLTHELEPYGNMYLAKVNLNGVESLLFISKDAINRMEPVRQSAFLGLQPGAVLSIQYESGFTYGKGSGLLFHGFAA